MKEKYVKTYSMSDIYGNTIDELSKLAHEGLILNINGVEQKVFFVCGLFIGIILDSDCVNLCFFKFNYCIF